jgi:hypothetical protein
LGSYLEDAAAGQKAPQTGDISFRWSGGGRFILALEGGYECEQGNGSQETTNGNKDHRPQPFLAEEYKPRSPVLHETLK